MDTPVAVSVDLRGTDVFAGQLYSHGHGAGASATFIYDAAYLSRPDAYPLDPRLPLLPGPHQTAVGQALFAAMTDSSPDRWGRRLLTRYRNAVRHGAGHQTMSEVDVLLGVRDDLRQGALRYAAERGGVKLAEDTSPVPRAADLAHLQDLARRSLDDRLTETELRLLLDYGSSLGGARPKVHARTLDGALAIAKFGNDATDRWDVPGWEHVTAVMARQAGIHVPDVGLLRIAGRSVLVTPRFDRTPSGRVGYWSAMTALESTDGAAGDYLDMAAFVETGTANPTVQLRELFTRAVFDMAVANTDNHLRNHGFLRQESSWTLAPAFDVNPNPDGGRFATGLPSRDGSDMTVAALLEAAPMFRLDEEAATGVLTRVLAATGRWRAHARQAGLPAGDIELMAGAFENDQVVQARRHVAAPSGVPRRRRPPPGGRATPQR